MSLAGNHMSRIMRKPTFCICKNKDADQLHGNREADQRLCFCYINSIIPLLSIYEISSLWPSCVAVQPGFCGTRPETPKTGFLTTRLIFFCSICTQRYQTDKGLSGNFFQGPVQSACIVSLMTLSICRLH